MTIFAVMDLSSGNWCGCSVLKVLAASMLISVGVEFAGCGVKVPAMVATAEDPVYFNRIKTIVAVHRNLQHIGTVATTGRIKRTICVCPLCQSLREVDVGGRTRQVAIMVYLVQLNLRAYCYEVLAGCPPEV